MLRSSVTAAVGVIALGLTSCTAPGSAPAPTKSAKPPMPATISLAVYGSEPVLATYVELVKSFEVQYPKVRRVKLQTFSDHAKAMASVVDQAKADATQTCSW